VHELDSLVAADAVRLLSEATGGQYRLVGRLAGGETGAHEVIDARGSRRVLKWDVEPLSIAARLTAVVLTETLRSAAGWPVPAQECFEQDGCLLVTQELLLGDPVRRLTHAVVDRMLELHTARLGLAPAEHQRTWPLELLTTLRTGGAGYCLHEPLRDFDQRTRRVIERIEELGNDVSSGTFAGCDIVHWDLHPGNLLALDGAVTAVIDNDFVMVGDAAFDLVTLALTSLDTESEPGVRERLAAEAFDGLDDDRRLAYTAHLVLRFLDWPIRRGRRDEIEFWTHQAERLLTLG